MDSLGDSNVVNAIPQSAIDTTPATLDDLVAWPVVSYQAASATLAFASTGLSGLSGANNILDGVSSTDWRITGDNANVNEHVSIDLENSYRWTAFACTARTRPALMPVFLLDLR